MVLRLNVKREHRSQKRNKYTMVGMIHLNGGKKSKHDKRLKTRKKFFFYSSFLLIIYKNYQNDILIILTL